MMNKNVSSKLLVALLLLSSATGTTGAEPSAPAPDRSSYTKSSDIEPLQLTQRPTTDGRIYINNLNANIESLQKAVALRSPGPLNIQLARALYHRFRVAGVLADLEAALAVLNQAVEDMPFSADAWLLLARVQASFHEFPSAIISLRRAIESKASPAATEELRYEIEQARSGGRKFVSTRSETISGSLAEYVQRANQAVNLGEQELAVELLTAAQFHYYDSNPFPLAWLHVQQGILWLRFDDPARAKIFFQTARDRLPAYYLATEHLAETELLLGNFDDAAGLYQEVYAQTGNPEFLAGLAQAEASLRSESAEATLQRAESEFQALVQRHPPMAWQHAAGFYLEQGQAQRALVLAQRNIEIRQDLQSVILLARAAAEAGAMDVACEQLQLGLSTGFSPPELLALVSKLQGSCEGNTRSSQKAS